MKVSESVQATVTSDLYEVRAGEEYKFTVRLDKAPSYEGGRLQAVFNAQQGRGSTDTVIATKAGEAVYHLRVTVPVAAPGGLWKLTQLEFNNSATWADLPHNDISFRVIPNPGIVSPSSAEVTVNPSQAQLLRREARRLQERIQLLKSTLTEYLSANREGAITPLLKKNLVEAASAVKATQVEFSKLATGEGQQASAEVFFDDLHRSYEDAISHFGRSTTTHVSVGHLVRVSNMNNGNSDPLISLALRPMEQNELAYKIVADEGSITFDLEVDSTPEGATVSYNRKGDPPHPNPDPTRATIHSLPYAIWIIHFEKMGYKSEDREHDPYRDPNHLVHVDLNK